MSISGIPRQTSSAARFGRELVAFCSVIGGLVELADLGPIVDPAPCVASGAADPNGLRRQLVGSPFLCGRQALLVWMGSRPTAAKTVIYFD